MSREEGWSRSDILSTAALAPHTTSDTTTLLAERLEHLIATATNPADVPELSTISLGSVRTSKGI